MRARPQVLQALRPPRDLDRAACVSASSFQTRPYPHTSSSLHPTFKTSHIMGSYHSMALLTITHSFNREATLLGIPVGS
jgi:hypothetical protein